MLQESLMAEAMLKTDDSKEKRRLYQRDYHRAVRVAEANGAQELLNVSVHLHVNQPRRVP